MGTLSSIAEFTWGGNFLALKQIFKVVIIMQIIYRGLIWYMLSGKKGIAKL